MKSELINKRVLMLAHYIVETKDTVRGAAKKFGVSKSTVHKDLSKRLPQCNALLFKQVRHILDYNKEQRHIRGGIATKNKYLMQKK